MNGYFSLAPYQPDGLIHEPSLRYKHLKLMASFVDNIIQAVEFFYLNKQYNYFDPHVGDNLCQIRASQLLSLSKKIDFDLEHYLDRMKNIKIKINALLPAYEAAIKKRREKQVKNIQDHDTLGGFIIENKLDFLLPFSVNFLVKSYLLTKYKIHPLGVSPRMNSELLCRDFDVSKDLGTRMIRYWQRSLSNYSCKYVEVLSNKSQSVLSGLKKTDDDQREVFPCYFVMKTILSNLIKKHMKILLVIRNPNEKNVEPLILSYNTNRWFEKFQFNKKFEMDRPHFTIWGVSNLITENSVDNRRFLLKKINAFGLHNILLTSVAHHPQFAGKNLEPYNEEPYKKLLAESNHEDRKFVALLKGLQQSYLEDKKLAIRSNCTLSGNTFIFAEHMLMSTPREQAQLLGVNDEYIFKKMLKRNLLRWVDYPFKVGHTRPIGELARAYE